VVFPPAPERSSLAARALADVETSSEGYARRFAGPVGDYFLEVQERLVRELLVEPPGARLLDVGGGHAQLAEPLVRAGYRVTVVGSDESCRERLDRRLDPASFEFRCGDLLALPFADRSFDVALAFRLLPHVDDWARLVAELCRVARRAVIVDYPERRSFNAVQGLFFGMKKAIEKNTRPFRCFARSQLVREFAQSGFGRPASRPEFFLPMAAYRALGSRPLARGLEAACRAVGLTGRLGSPVVLRVERLEPPRGAGVEP